MPGWLRRLLAVPLSLLSVWKASPGLIFETLSKFDALSGGYAIGLDPTGPSHNDSYVGFRFIAGITAAVTSVKAAIAYYGPSGGVPSAVTMHLRADVAGAPGPILETIAMGTATQGHPNFGVLSGTASGGLTLAAGQACWLFGTAKSISSWGYAPGALPLTLAAGVAGPEGPLSVPTMDAPAAFRIEGVILPRWRLWALSLTNLGLAKSRGTS
jgi:hypothetical protein